MNPLLGKKGKCPAFWLDLKSYFPARAGVDELQTIGTERHIRYVQRLGGGLCRLAAIFHVSQKRQPPMCHLGTDLMKTSREDMDVYQSQGLGPLSTRVLGSTSSSSS